MCVTRGFLKAAMLCLAQRTSHYTRVWTHTFVSHSDLLQIAQGTQSMMDVDTASVRDLMHKTCKYVCGHSLYTIYNHVKCIYEGKIKGVKRTEKTDMERRKRDKGNTKRINIFPPLLTGFMDNLEFFRIHSLGSHRK